MSVETAPAALKGTRRAAQGGGFLHHAALYGLGSISVQLVSILLMPVYTDRLSTAEFGLLQTIYRVGDVLNICLMVNGIRLATFSLWGKAREDSERTHLPASVALFTALVLSIGSLLVFAGSNLLALKLDFEDSRLLACGVVAMMLQAVTVMPLALMQSRMESKWFVASTLLITVCQMCLVIFALVVLQWGVWGVVVALAATYGSFGLLLTARELWMYSFIPERGHILQIAKFSAPFIPSGLFIFILHSGDQFFLLRYHDLASVGVYALGYKITRAVVMFASQPFIQVWTAWMYDVYTRPDRSVVFGKVFTRILGAFLFAGTGVIVFQDQILQILSHPKYARAGTVIGTLVFAHFFLVLANLLDSAFYATRRTDLKPWISAGSAAVMTLAYALLIPRWEIQGAAIATLLGYMFHAGLTMAVAQQTFFVKIEFGRLAVLLGGAVLVSVVARALGGGLANLPLKCFVWCLFPVALWYLAVISDTEKDAVRRGCEQVNAWWTRRTTS